MKLIIPKKLHTAGFCEKLGALAKQNPGGWSIEHECHEGNVSLTVPDGVVTDDMLRDLLRKDV